MSEAQSVALVTGASSGIGRAVAARLSQDGFPVLIHYHKNAAGAEETFTQVVKAGGKADVIQFDVADADALQTALDDYFKDGEKRLDALINNAGIHVDNLAGLMTDSEFDRVVRTDLYGPFFLMRWAVRKMLRQRKGNIVNISSLSGQTGNPGQINYSAAKAGLIAMTKTLSQEVGSRGIRVNAVAPGLIETEMTDSIDIEPFKKRIPLRRLGKVEEVAGVVSFLCSSDASYITGQTLSVNGGLFPA